MGTAIFMVLMVCGYWYTSRDLSTRLKLRRTFGWDVYFLVALYGCIFVLQGILTTAIIWLCLLLTSIAMNAVPEMTGSDDHRLQMTFMNWSFLGIQAPVVIMLAFAILFCLYRSNWARSANLNSDGRRQLYKYLSRANGIEGLIYQCMETGQLAWLTLKSQRVYIGMIHTATVDSTSLNNIVLIPMLTGYRERDSAEFKIENNYSALYASQNITLSSEPHSALHFRKVILLDQVESISLFDPSQSLALGYRKESEANGE
ncbi:MULTISPECIES: hypothetical protein [unclassified Enterobacter]|uniref:hypothetical protein n=1 Tax=unclassified Enterobacter TaxID=2608935 RepID=UPI0008F27E11|nr:MULTISPECIES: hypothetical protein [unclassified Enterobacter]SFR12209.1 hypothetical protein SAMN04487773_2976 [Enterobacter sp. kpr-6]